MTEDEVVQKLAEEPNWRPYCLKCTTFKRMPRFTDCFRCSCGAQVFINLDKLKALCDERKGVN